MYTYINIHIHINFHTKIDEYFFPFMIITVHTTNESLYTLLHSTGWA